jgi:hypothetical protein
VSYKLRKKGAVLARCCMGHHFGCRRVRFTLIPAGLHFFGAGPRRGPAAALLPNDTGKIVPLVLGNRVCLTYTQSWVSWLSHAELGLHWSHRTAVRCTPPRAAYGASSGARGSPQEHEGTQR